MTVHSLHTKLFISRALLALATTLLFLILGGSEARAQAEPTMTAQELLDGAVDQLQAAYSFKLSIAQTGAPYPLALSFDGVNLLPATLTGAEAQYVSPNALHISAWLQFFLPLALDIYSQDDRQWLSFPSGAPWILLPAFEDFDTNRLLAAGDGIEYVMENLQDARLVERDAPPDEDDDWQVRGRAAGAGVSGLLFGFIEPQDDVEISAFIEPEDGRFASLEITMLETVGDPQTEPSVWHIRFYDYDAPPDFEAPEA